jgi:hypothetical protein
MDNAQLKIYIESSLMQVAQDIEKFCSVTNTEYTIEYKNKLREIHSLIETL